MDNITLKVYDENFDTIKKECKAKMVVVPFGLIRKLMTLFDVEKLDDTTQILNVVMSSWDTVVSLLDRVFPDMEENDWDYVDTKELVQIIFSLLKFAFAEMVNIPTDPKN